MYYAENPRRFSRLVHCLLILPSEKPNLCYITLSRAFLIFITTLKFMTRPIIAAVFAAAIIFCCYASASAVCEPTQLSYRDGRAA